MYIIKTIRKEWMSLFGGCENTKGGVEISSSIEYRSPGLQRYNLTFFSCSATRTRRTNESKDIHQIINNQKLRNMLCQVLYFDMNFVLLKSVWREENEDIYKPKGKKTKMLKKFYYWWQSNT